MTKYIYLAGGFGNNMFQICYGVHLEKLGYQVIYKTALQKKNIFTSLFNWTVHHNELTELFLDGKEVDESLSFLDILFLTKTMIKKAISRDNLYTAPHIDSSNRFFGYFVIGEHLNLDTFKSLRSVLEQVKPKASKLNECSIHLRKGDFAIHQRLTSDYYINAIKSCQPLSFVNLLTDSPLEADNLKNRVECDLVLSSSKSMKNDFFEIYNSKIVIMSNSTFCYWAAVLGESERLIYPSRISEHNKWPFFLNKDSKVLSSFFESE